MGPHSKITMKIRFLLGALIAAGFVAAPLHAQEKKDTTVKQKTEKVAHNVGATVKKAGSGTKAEVKRDAPKVDTAARKTGGGVKHGVEKAASATKNAAKATGKKIKSIVKKDPKDTTKTP